MAPNEDTTQGFWLALSGYFLWGFFPIYFYLLRHVAATEILAHRIIWSMLLLMVVSLFIKSKVRWQQIITSSKLLLPCLLSGLLLSSNWLIFIWAIGNGEAVQGSLGYFINPLLNVLMGTLFLNERLNKYQITALIFACIGVLFMVYKSGEIPWISLSLAALFASYGLLHKKFDIDPLAGLTIETILLAPVAIGYMIYLFSLNQNAFLSGDASTDGLLLLAGVVTSAPLLLFLLSLPLLRLSTVGLLQFIVPTMQLLVAVYVFAEPFGRDKFIAFCIIWIGLLIFCFDTIRQRRLRNKMNVK